MPKTPALVFFFGLGVRILGATVLVSGIGLFVLRFSASGEGFQLWFKA